MNSLEIENLKIDIDFLNLFPEYFIYNYFEEIRYQIDSYYSRVKRFDLVTSNDLRPLLSQYYIYIYMHFIL